MSTWIRKIHRWLAVAFTAGFIANFFVMGQQPYPLWAGVAALLPLGLLLLTGWYMFVLPYVAKWRRGPVASKSEPLPNERVIQ